jgi:hypothetical protein
MTYITSILKKDYTEKEITTPYQEWVESLALIALHLADEDMPAKDSIKIEEDYTGDPIAGFYKVHQEKNPELKQAMMDKWVKDTELSDDACRMLRELAAHLGFSTKYGNRGMLLRVKRDE